MNDKIKNTFLKIQFFNYDLYGLYERTKQIYNDILSVLISSVSARAFALFNSVLAARLLTVEDYGLYATFYAIMILTWQFSQGFDTAYIKYYKACENPKDEIDILRVNLFSKSFYFIVIALIGVFLSNIIADIIFKKPDINIVLKFSLFSGASMVFLVSVMAYFQAREKFKIFSLFYLSFTLIVFISMSILYFAYNEVELRDILNIYLSVSFLLGVAGYIFLFKQCNNKIICKLKILKAVLGFSKWTFLSSLIFFVFSRLDVLMITRYLDFGDIGVYAAGAQITTIYTTFTGTINGVFWPKSIEAARDNKQFNKYLMDMVVPSLLILTGFLLIAGNSEFIVQQIFGSKYDNASEVLRILTLGWVLYYFYAISQDLYYTLGLPKVRFAVETVKLILAILFVFIFTPKWGVIGAAYAIALTMAVSTVLSLLLLAKKFRYWFKFNRL